MNLELVKKFETAADQKLISNHYASTEYYKIKDLSTFFNVPEKNISDHILDFDDYILGDDYGVIEDEYVVFFDGFLMLCMTLTGSKTCINMRKVIFRIHKEMEALGLTKPIPNFFDVLSGRRDDT